MGLADDRTSRCLRLVAWRSGKRIVHLGAGALSPAVDVQPLVSGQLWRFWPTPDILARLATLIERERQFGPFLRIEVTAAAGLGGIVLDGTGPPGTVGFLGRWLPSATQ